MFVIFSDSISNVIKIIEFRTGMDLIDEKSQGSEKFSELLNGKGGTSSHVFWFSVGHLSVIQHCLIDDRTEHENREGSFKSSGPTCSFTSKEMGPRDEALTKV